MEERKLIFLLNTSTSLFFENAVINKKSAELAAKIAYYNFEWRYVTIVFYYNLNFFGGYNFLKNYQKSVAIKYGSVLRIINPLIPQYVVFGTDTLNILYIIRSLIKTKNIYNIGKFIIVCMSENDCDQNIIFKSCFNYKIVNVILIRPTSDSLEPSAYTYYPIVPGKCANHDPIKLNVSLNCLNDLCFKELYPLKYNNLYGCEIIISTFEQHPYMYINKESNEVSGNDGDILMLLLRTLNAKHYIVDNSDGSGHFQNNSWTGSMGDIFYDKANFSMTSASLTYTKYGNFQISVPYNSMDAIWVTSMSEPSPSWEKLIHPFKLYVRFILLLIFISIIIINIFIKTKKLENIRKILKIKPPKSNLIFYSWLIFLGVPILRMPSKSVILIVVYLWIWSCLIIRSVYQAALISSLKMKIYEENFQTFDEVLEAEYPFGGPTNLKEYFKEQPKIFNKWKDIKSDHIVKVLDNLADKSLTFVMAINKNVVLDYLLNQNNTKQLHIIPGNILSSPSVLYFKKFSPLTTSINRILSAIVEGGFTQTSAFNLKRDRKLILNLISDTPDSLKLTHFAGPILILIVGWIICIVLFFIEILIIHYRGKRYILTKIQAITEKNI